MLCRPRRGKQMDVLLSGPESHDGLVHVTFVSRGDRTDLARLLQRGSLRIFRPNVPPGDLPNAVLLNTSGGIVGGDRLAVRVRMEPGAAALITSQAAEKAYRSAGPDATVDIHLDLADHAWLEWLPQETILFDGARLRRCLSVRAATAARLLAADMLVFGRRARGERFRHGVLHDRIEIWVDDRLVWADALRLAPEPGPLLEAPFGFAGAAALATCFYLAADAEAHIATAREFADAADVRSGATCIGPVLVVRWLADDPARVRQACRRFCTRFRRAVAGLPERAPAIWRT
jgi:urease accessory protein